MGNKTEKNTSVYLLRVEQKRQHYGRDSLSIYFNVISTVETHILYMCNKQKEKIEKLKQWSCLLKVQYKIKI